MPAGLDGSMGQPGTHGRARLEDGRDGPTGSVEIFIANKDGQIAGPYASAFSLELVGFDIVDGNEDGIFEFGEEIILKNIRVKNSGQHLSDNKLTLGGSPSPILAPVIMQGASNTWIDPQTTLMLPTKILSNSTITCPGVLTLRAKNANIIPTESALTVNDTFSIEAHLTKIERSLPGFRRSERITLQYPIEMSKPKFLRCLSAGQVAVFSWTVTAFYTKG